MLDQQFLNIASKLNGRFGTENVGPLLYSMVKLCRPRTVLEVGAGYSTLCILKALMDNVEDDDMERKAGTNIYGKTDYYHQRYDPVLVTLDDYSLSSTLAHKVMDASTSLGLDRYLAIKKADFQGYSNKINPAVLPFDFIWFDCGGLDEYINFTN